MFSLKELCEEGRIVCGFNQARKLIKKGEAERVYIASDAGISLQYEIGALCAESAVLVDKSCSMQALGKQCLLDVGCAVAVVKKVKQCQ